MIITLKYLKKGFFIGSDKLFDLMNSRIFLFFKEIKKFFIGIGTILFLSGYIYLIYRVARKFPAGQPRADIVLEMTIGVIMAGFILWAIIAGSISLISWMREKWLEVGREIDLKDIQEKATVIISDALKKRIEAEKKETEEMENRRIEPKPAESKLNSMPEPEQPGGRYKIAIGKKF